MKTIGFDGSLGIRHKGGMRILHVMAGSEAGGAETAFAELCAAQARAGLTVFAACRPSPRNDAMRAAGVEIIELPFGGPFDLYTRYALKKLIAHEEPQTVITWMNRAARKLPKRNRKFAWVARLGGYYSLKYYKGVDHFVVNAPDIGRWMEERGVDNNRISFIPNFAEIDVNATPVDRASLDTKPSDFVFLTLARLHTNKAIDVLLTAFAQVPDAILWIGGDGPERKALTAQAAALGIENRVRFLGWREDRWALLAASDAFVFPSRHEPFGNSFMQAWAAGKALVTTASQGPSYYVQHEQDALVSPIDDADALAISMNRIKNDAALQNKLAQAGRLRYAQAFDKDSILNQWRALFVRLTGQQGRS